MTAPVKYTSKGGSLLLSISSVFTALGAVESIDGPDPEVEQIDVTALDSAVGKEHQVTGYTEPGTAGCTLYFDPANTTHKAVTAYLTSPSTGPSSWKLTYPDVAATSWTWSAIVTKFKPTMKVGDFLKATMSMQITGLVTGW